MIFALSPKQIATNLDQMNFTGELVGEVEDPRFVPLHVLISGCDGRQDYLAHKSRLQPWGLPK
jgi:hypothetical protein